MKCDHVFMGRAEGVTCMRCGLRMTTDEFMAYLGTPEEPKEEPNEEPKEEPKEEPEAPKKPKRARKPKEEPKHG